MWRWDTAKGKWIWGATGGGDDADPRQQTRETKRIKVITTEVLVGRARI